MALTKETGHAKNVAILEKLVSFCAGYGPDYNPSNPALRVDALQSTQTDLHLKLDAMKNAKTNHQNATNAREVAFKFLKKLTLRIISALVAAGVAAETLDDARAMHNRIQGRRPKKSTGKPEGENETVAEAAPAEEPARKNTVRQQSYDRLVDNFAQLVKTVTAEPAYTPNEQELTAASLAATLADLRAKNTAVTDTTTALSNARVARDTSMYETKTGLIDLAKAVKGYVRSRFGASSLQFKQVRSLKFVNMRRKR